MKNRVEEKYIRYGISTEWAAEFVRLGLSVSTFRATPQKVLVSKHGVDKDKVKLTKKCLRRKEIDDDVVEALLRNSRYVCCLCRGTKSDAYVIHHINGYATTQDNSYDNLVVLCPNDHDLAHREGELLTQKISPEQLRKSRNAWEKRVKELDAQEAAEKGDISDVDFVNAYRVLELYKETFRKDPITDLSKRLNQLGVLFSDGSINAKGISENGGNEYTPFMGWNPVYTWNLHNHFSSLFWAVLSKVSCVDLDTLLNREALKKGIEGTLCYYIGGIYGKPEDSRFNNSGLMTRLYFHRKGYWVDWLVDNSFMTSNTALHRLSDRRVCLIYGRIISVGIKKQNNKEYAYIGIRPLLFGTPHVSKERIPDIAYFNKFNDLHLEEDDWL